MSFFDCTPLQVWATGMNCAQPTTHCLCIVQAQPDGGAESRNMWQPIPIQQQFSLPASNPSTWSGNCWGCQTCTVKIDSTLLKLHNLMNVWTPDHILSTKNMRLHSAFTIKYMPLLYTHMTLAITASIPSNTVGCPSSSIYQIQLREVTSCLFEMRSILHSPQELQEICRRWKPHQCVLS